MPPPKKPVSVDKQLTKLLKKIGLEESEITPIGDEAPKIMTKIEALARTVWRKALGYEYKDTIGGKKVLKTKLPDKDMIQLIWDRHEGRVATASDPGTEKTSLPDKVAEVQKLRLNSLAQNAAADNSTAS